MEKNCRADQDAKAFIQNDVGHVWHHMLQHSALANNEPLIVVEGEGLRIRDIHGREYLDATSGGVWCVNLGYGQTSLAKGGIRSAHQNALLRSLGR